MIIFTFSILVFWLIIFIFSFFILIEKKPKPNTNVVESRIDSKKILEIQPKIRELIKEITRTESLLLQNPDSEAIKTRLAILRAKLRLSIRNPVVRQALISAIKNN